MSDRDELAVIVYDMTDDNDPPTMETCRDIADVLWAAGWRKSAPILVLADAIMGGAND